MGKENFCSICKSRINDNIGSMVKYDHGEYILCKECSKNSVSMAKLPEVMIVPVSPKSMETIIETKEYLHPNYYARKGGQYLAFYVCNPVSAITHYAKVKYILKDVDIEYVSFYNLDSVDPNEKYKVYKLEDIIQMEIQIVRGGNEPIQNARNTTLHKLLNAKSLGDI